MPYRERCRLWMIIGVLLLTVGCSPPSEPFRVGTNIWIGYEPLYLADALGYYDGEPIRLVAMSNATEVQRAMRAGVLEAAALTLDEALNLVADGFDLRVVLVMDASNGADVLLARPEIADLSALRGRRVGVESSATGVILLNGALEAANLAITDITVVHIAVDHHEAAFRNGEVDAIVTFEPVRTQLLASGAHILFDSSRIPNRILDVLVTTPEIATAHQATLRKLIAGHFRALHELRSNPMAAAERMVQRQRLAPADIVASYKGLSIPDLAENRRMLAPAPELSNAAKRLADIMFEHRMLPHPVATEQLFDARWLPTQ